MEALLGFQIDFWDYATFLSLFVIGAVVLGSVVYILGLPGRIAIKRRHPEAEAVYLMGWIGFLTVVPWIQAAWSAFRAALGHAKRLDARGDRAGCTAALARAEEMYNLH